MEQQFKALGAQGSGLRERAFDLEIHYPPDIRQDLHYIAQWRNAISHGELSDLPNEESEVYQQACERVTLFLDSWLARHGVPRRRGQKLVTPVPAAPAPTVEAAALPNTCPAPASAAAPRPAPHPVWLVWGLRVVFLGLAFWALPRYFLAAGPLIDLLPALVQPFAALAHLMLCVGAFGLLLMRAASPLRPPR